MSWLTDLAGKAENLLNKIDEQTGQSIQKAKSKSRGLGSETDLSGHRIGGYSQDQESSQNITEEIGTRGPSLPSRTHSEFAGGYSAVKKKITHEAFAPSTSSVRDSKERSPKEESKNLEDELFADFRSRRSSGVSNASGHKNILQNESPDLDQLKSQIWAKDAQIATMKAKLTDSERKLEKRDKEFYELKAEKDMLVQSAAQNQSQDSMEELKFARQKLQQQKEMVTEECNQLKKKNLSLEEEVRSMIEQLRLAKFNLSENKKEFDEYKQKAQKILQAKEKLVESLKSEQGIKGDERAAHLAQAELEEIKVERDLARADLESAQLMVYNLRSEIDELETQLRENQNQVAEQKRLFMEEKLSWQAANNLLNEKIECGRIECEFVKQEMKRQADDFARKFEDKDKECRRAIDEVKQRKREDEFRASSGFDNIGSSLTAAERLLQKQTELEEALRSNQVLTLKLERLTKAGRETYVPMDSSSAAPPTLPVHNPTARKALSHIDQFTFRVLAALRNYPSARLFFVVYFVLIHLWVFFIIITYTPEMHDIEPKK
ncbi:hypothetical protein WR25_07597 [Diploscapter pachys]|uniref:Uncharacterized protein n=1 Tax=Diploscapter pachys TaxID=2018661 RepID=A0A2A2LQ49_9BILA|nr:hypothetical protein WR25_07597 [Diploscapter pachys]